MAKRSLTMPNVTVHSRGYVAHIQCQGRIVAGAENSILINAVRSQTSSQLLILDLAEVDRVDAGGLGILLGLRAWARSRSIQLELRNVQSKVQKVFEVTRLDGVFEISPITEIPPLSESAARPHCAAPPGAL